MTQLPVQPAWRLADRPEQQRWLVDALWSDEAVGIIGGEPKCGKSFLALDLAVAVAAGIPCLRRFAVSRPGRVLLYPAEDALHIVRRRLDGICAAAGISLAALDVQVITAPSLRLDLEADRASLDETVARLQPRLLVLDPFVRLHRIDENASGEVAPVLAFLRELQRRHAIAVVLVHHARKGAGTIQLTQRDNALALELVQPDRQLEPPAAPTSVDQRITAVLAERRQPQPFAELRTSCRVRTPTLYQRLAAMIADGIVVKSVDGYSLSAH